MVNLTGQGLANELVVEVVTIGSPSTANDALILLIGNYDFQNP